MDLFITLELVSKEVAKQVTYSEKFKETPNINPNLQH